MNQGIRADNCSRRLLLVSATTLLTAACVVPLRAGAQDESGARAQTSSKATAEDVGLPLYPGARPHKNKNEDSDSLVMGLSSGWFGFKIAMLTMESTDSRDKVAAFYVKALAKYGKVLNCTDPLQANKAKDKGGASGELTCDSDGTPQDGEAVFKAGSKDHQHIVSVKSKGSGSLFDLMFVEGHAGK
jgi:hypothetical protein